MTDTFITRGEQHELVALLREIPSLAQDLAVALTAAGHRTKISYQPKVSTGEHEPTLPYNADADDASHQLWSELGMWVQIVQDHRGINCEATTTVGYSRWLDRNVIALAMTPGSETALPRIAEVVKAARRCSTVTREPSWKTGDADQARATELHPTAIALAAKELGDDYRTLTYARVVTLQRRGRITPVRTIETTGAQLFRLGDVMDAHLAHRTRRASA